MKIIMKLYKRYHPATGKFLSYYVRYDDGKRVSLKTRDKTKAQRAYKAIQREAFAGRIADITGICTVTLGAFQREYLEWAETAIDSKSTFRANRLALSKLVDMAGKSIKLDRLGQKHIDLMIAECRKNRNKTDSINNYIRHARIVIKKAVEWKYIKNSPFADVKELPRKKRLPKFIKKAELSGLLSKIKDKDLRRMVTAYIATGRRRSELVGLRWENVSLEDGRYTVKTETTKSKLERSYKINRLFLSVLLSIGPKEGGYVFERWRHPDTVSHRVKEALIKGGYGNLSLHSLRHTFASMKAAEGRTLLEIQQLLGHSDIKATMIYSHLTDEHVDDIGEVNIGPVDLGG